MTVRTGYRLLLESEKEQSNPLYLMMDARGSGVDPSIYVTVAGAGHVPYDDDPVLVLTADEARELVTCVECLLENDEGVPERRTA